MKGIATTLAAVAALAASAMLDVHAKVVVIANAQSAVPASALEYVRTTMRQGLRLPVKILDEGSAAAPRLPTGDEGFLLRVVDDANNPLRFFCAPDDGVAVVNVRPLMADGPNGKTLERRVMKECWRAFVYAMGGGNTATPPCLMKPCASLADVDELGSCCPSPEVFNNVMRACKKRGIEAKADGESSGGEGDGN